MTKLESVLGVCFVSVAGFTSICFGQWTATVLHPQLANVTASSGIAASGSRQFGFVSLSNGRSVAARWDGTAASYVSLSPTGTLGSQISGAFGDQQVGLAYVGGLNPSNYRASLWRGTASSWVNLHPSGASRSWAYATDGARQVGWAQFGTGSEAVDRAVMWTGSPTTWINLHPASAVSSEAFGISANQQVGRIGIERPSNGGFQLRACLWTGTASSFVDLHPAGVTQSTAYATDGRQQVGTVESAHAALWSGTASAFVNLNPPGSIASQAIGVKDGRQVGHFYVPFGQYSVSRACLWAGTANSCVDLHAFLPSQFISSTADAISDDGEWLYVVGSASSDLFGATQAVSWKRRLRCSLSDVAGPNQLMVADGELTADDIVVFLAWFFADDTRADVSGPNQSVGADGQFSADDIIIFLNRYFTGC